MLSIKQQARLQTHVLLLDEPADDVNPSHVGGVALGDFKVLIFANVFLECFLMLRFFIEYTDV